MTRITHKHIHDLVDYVNDTLKAECKDVQVKADFEPHYGGWLLFISNNGRSVVPHLISRKPTREFYAFLEGLSLGVGRFA